MRNVITIIAALVVLAVVAEAVVIYSGAYYVGADKPHWSITTWLLKQARDRSIRVHASGIAVPASLDDRAKILAGVSHYAEHCAVCHGAPGVQRGDMAEGLYIHSRRIWLTRLAPIAPASCSGSSSTGSG